MRIILLFTVGATLAACAVGPDFRTPDAPLVQGYVPEPFPAETSTIPGTDNPVQRFTVGGKIAHEWWKLFRSEALDQLIRNALAESPTISAAKARIREAEENLRARGGTVYSPSIDGDFSAARRKTTGASYGQPDAGANTFTLYNASVAISYTLDIFGGNRRELEALRAQVDNQRYLLEGAHIALTANIITAAVNEAALRDQIRATREIVSLLEKQLETVNRQYEFGAASGADVLAQRAQLARTQATLPPLEKELAQTRNLLAVLVGRFPGEGGLPVFELDDMHLPEELPVSLPSTLVRQRPDILASEALLHAACAQVGVATANLFPKITLSGSLGTNAVRIEDLFTSGASLWSLGAGLVQPLFHGGELTAKRRAAVAAYDMAAAQYRDTVLQAFRNVADTLHALETDARTLKAQAEAEQAARELLLLAQQEFQIGALDYLALLNAERQYQDARLSLVSARAARFADTAALYQAVGGGWWNDESDLPQDQPDANHGSGTVPENDNSLAAKANEAISNR